LRLNDKLRHHPRKFTQDLVVRSQALAQVAPDARFVGVNLSL
jgi:hypothetical protein